VLNKLSPEITLAFYLISIDCIITETGTNEKSGTKMNHAPDLK
jgi:hypothetical protein